MPKSFRILFVVLVLLVPATAQADPVPALTIIGGTITGGRGSLGSIGVAAGGVQVNLIGVDPLTGTMYNIFAGSEGGFSVTPFAAGPGETVTFGASISGTADFGFANVNAGISGEGPPIPNVMQPTLDLQGFGTASIQGTFYASINDMLFGGTPIFTIPFQTFSGPLALHFITIAPGDPRYELRRATLTISEPVPEPASVILLVTSLVGLGLSRRRKIH